MKKLLPGIKAIVNLRDSKLGPSIHLKDDCDHLINNPVTVSNTFNDFFANVCSATANSIPKTTTHFSNFLKGYYHDSFF